MSEPGGGGEDGSAGLEVSAVQNVADVSVLQKHLRKLVPLLLEDGGEAPAALEAALEEKSALEQMRKFLSDPQVHTVLVERSTLKGAGPGLRWVPRRPASLPPHPLPPGPQGAPFRVAGTEEVAQPRRHPQQWDRFVSSASRWPSWVETASPGLSAGGGRIPASNVTWAFRFRFASRPRPASGGMCQGWRRGQPGLWSFGRPGVGGDTGEPELGEP